MFYSSKNHDQNTQYSNSDLIFDAQEKLEKMQHSLFSANQKGFDQTPKHNNKFGKTTISPQIMENNLQYPYIIEAKTKYSNPYSNNSNEETGAGFNVLKNYISSYIEKGNNNKLHNSYKINKHEEKIYNFPQPSSPNDEDYLDKMKLNEYISHSSRSDGARTKSFSSHCEILKPFVVSVCDNYIQSNETHIQKNESNINYSKNANPSIKEGVIITPENESIKRGKHGNTTNFDKTPNIKFDKTISHFSESKALHKRNITNLLQKTIETENFFKSFPSEFIEKGKNENSFKNSNKKKIFDLKIPASVVSSTPNRVNNVSESFYSNLKKLYN